MLCYVLFLCMYERLNVLKKQLAKPNWKQNLNGWAAGFPGFFSRREISLIFFHRNACTSLEWIASIHCFHVRVFKLYMHLHAYITILVTDSGYSLTNLWNLGSWYFPSYPLSPLTNVPEPGWFDVPWVQLDPAGGAAWLVNILQGLLT